MSRFGTIPTILSLEYGFSDFYFRHNARLDAKEHRGLCRQPRLSAGRMKPTSPIPLTTDRARALQTTATKAIAFNSDTEDGFAPIFNSVDRRLFFYKIFFIRTAGIRRVASDKTRCSPTAWGFFIPGQGTNLFIDYRWQENRSNLGPAFVSQEDILLGRSTALGDYEKER